MEAEWRLPVYDSRLNHICWARRRCTFWIAREGSVRRFAVMREPGRLKITPRRHFKDGPTQKSKSQKK